MKNTQCTPTLTQTPSSPFTWDVRLSRQARNAQRDAGRPTPNDAPPAPSLTSHCSWGGSRVEQQRQQRAAVATTRSGRDGTTNDDTPPTSSLPLVNAHSRGFFNYLTNSSYRHPPLYLEGRGKLYYVHDDDNDDPNTILPCPS